MARIAMPYKITPDSEGDLCFENKPLGEASSFFYETRTMTSVEEMRGSLLEGCCPGDGVGSGCLSLLTAAVSPTMLALPLAFSLGGVRFALACILFCIVMTILSVRILAHASASASSDDYETVTEFFLGAKGKWLARFVLFSYNFGCGVVYLCLVKDNVIDIVRSKGGDFLPSWLQGTAGGFAVFVLFVASLTPFTFNSRLASLRTKGLVSNALTTFIIGSITYRYFIPSKSVRDSGTRRPELTQGRLMWWELAIPYMFAAPIFIFSYEVQSNVMEAIKDINDRTGKRIFVCISMALAIATAFYLPLGIFGSLSFPNISHGNILALYDLDQDPLMFLCQVFCCYSAGVSFVFCMFPCRFAVFMLTSDGTSSKISRKKRTRFGIALTITAGICAIVLPDVATVVSLSGSLLSSTLSLTLPAIFALKMRRGGTYLTSTLDGWLSWLMLILGVSFSISGTAIAFLDILGYGPSV